MLRVGHAGFVCRNYNKILVYAYIIIEYWGIVNGIPLRYFKGRAIRRSGGGDQGGGGEFSSVTAVGNLWYSKARLP